MPLITDHVGYMRCLLGAHTNYIIGEIGEGECCIGCNVRRACCICIANSSFCGLNAREVADILISDRKKSQSAAQNMPDAVFIQTA